MSDKRDDIIVMIDEDGEEVEVEHIDTIEYKGSEYVILRPFDDDDEDSDDDDINDIDDIGETDDDEGDAQGRTTVRVFGVPADSTDDDADEDDDGCHGHSHSHGDGCDSPDCECSSCPHSEECFDDADEVEIVILRVQKDSSGSETYVTITDMGEAEAVFDLFMERQEDESLDDDIDTDGFEEDDEDE